MKNEKYDICLDCDEERYVDTETSELVCQSCGKVDRLAGVVFDEAQFFSQEGQTRQPTPTEKSDTYLRKTLEKYKILDAVNITVSDGREVYDPARYRFLGVVINNFGDDGKSVNYACFLHDYFQAVSSDAWPRKEEILELLSPHLPKISKTRWRAKARFHKWWEETIPR
jgi:hypothetical protein